MPCRNMRTAPRSPDLPALRSPMSGTKRIVSASGSSAAGSTRHRANPPAHDTQKLIQLVNMQQAGEYRVDRYSGDDRHRDDEQLGKSGTARNAIGHSPDSPHDGAR